MRDGWTDGWTDGQTDGVKHIYPLPLCCGGIIMTWSDYLQQCRIIMFPRFLLRAYKLVEHWLPGQAPCWSYTHAGAKKPLIAMEQRSRDGGCWAKFLCFYIYPFFFKNYYNTSYQYYIIFILTGVAAAEPQRHLPNMNITLVSNLYFCTLLNQNFS